MTAFIAGVLVGAVIGPLLVLLAWKWVEGIEKMDMANKKEENI